MSTQEKDFLALGLMSGTSADGIDVALVRTDGESLIDPLGGTTVPYESSFRRRLLQLARHDVPLLEVLRVQQQLTDLHASAIRVACEQLATSPDDLDVVGFHGHTVRHLPAEHLSWQIGNGSQLAQRIGRPVVCDFRQADLAAGGQGAPLAPLYHQAILRNWATAHDLKLPQMALNLGGVANLTWFDQDQIISGDTGPGCGLLDAWVERHTGQSMDRDGELALHGRVHGDLVSAILADFEFFQQPLPKSADRFDFDAIDLDGLSLQDGAATLCALTVGGVAAAVATLPQPPRHVWVTGGGGKHPLMMQLLQDKFSPSQVAPISTVGHHPDLLEAECFAWLAVRRLRGLPTSLPSTTGARVATCGGQLV